MTFGYVSFSFYMIHQLGISVIRFLINKIGLVLSWQLEMSITLVIIVTASYLIYYYFETPISCKLISKLNNPHQ